MSPISCHTGQCPPNGMQVSLATYPVVQGATHLGQKPLESSYSFPRIKEWLVICDDLVRDTLRVFTTQCQDTLTKEQRVHWLMGGVAGGGVRWFLLDDHLSRPSNGHGDCKGPTNRNIQRFHQLQGCSWSLHENGITQHSLTLVPAAAADFWP